MSVRAPRSGPAPARPFARAAVLVVLAAVSCARPRAAGPAPQPETRLDERDDGRTVSVAPGTVLAVRLPVTSGTGYRWEQESPPAPCVEVLSWSQEAAAGPGAPAAIAVRLRATAGECEVALRYVRPWEDGVAPARRFTVHVVAR